MSVAAFVDGLDREMAAAGFARVAEFTEPTYDGVAYRYRPAQADALTLNLPALTVIVTGLEIATNQLGPELAKQKAAEALAEYYAP